MKSAKEFGPGVLRTFRQLSGVQFVFTALSVIAQRFAFFQFKSDSLTLSALNLVGPGLLFLYLLLPSLQRFLKSFYVPIGIVLATAGPVFEPYLASNQSPDIAADWLWRQTLMLCVPLVVISLQYSMHHVVLFGTLTAILNVTLSSSQELFSSSLLAIILLQLTIYLLLGNVIVNITKVQREQWRRLTEANSRLAQYASTLEQLTISQERNRLARELHDVLAHTLSGVAVELEGLRAVLHVNPERANALLDHSLRAIREGLTETRRALQELRARPIEDLGLTLALKGLIASIAERAGVEIEITIDHPLDDYTSELEQCIYRITQEALVNIASHAQATCAQVILKREETQLTLTITDNGCGFEPGFSGPENHYGLQGMRERAEMVGGRLLIESQVGKGTKIVFLYGVSQ